MTTIVCPAIRNNGTVFQGVKGQGHSDVMYEMLRADVTVIEAPEYGFVTEAGDFVDREEAMRLALEAGQVKKGETRHPTLLYSTDI